MKHILEHMHEEAPGNRGVVVPDPVAGAYTFWDDFSDDSLSGAGWHTWEPGIDSDDVMKYMVQPFPAERVFVIGEAYSNEQGWIEGALKSVERVMDKFGIRLPDETFDPNAGARQKAKSDAMRNHVGVSPREPEKPEPVTAFYSAHRTIPVGDCDEMVFIAGKIGFNNRDLPSSRACDRSSASGGRGRCWTTAAGTHSRAPARSSSSIGSLRSIRRRR